jgi:hypothetical protein
MIQADYDVNFNKSIKDSNKIYRLEIINGLEYKQAVISRPLSEIFSGRRRIS